MALGVVAAPPREPAAGGVWVKGVTGTSGQFQLNLKVAAPDVAQFTVYAVKVHSEPSGTFLFASVDETAPVRVLMEIYKQMPRAMTTGVVAGVEVSVGVSPPPVSDTSIRVEYILQDGDGEVTYLAAEVTSNSLEEFEWIMEPDSGGGFEICDYCSGVFCGCIRCSKPIATVCCPSCVMTCLVIQCP
jgi:hypothetical protein